MTGILGNLTVRPAMHHSDCFGCGIDNQIGLKLALAPTAIDTLSGNLTLRPGLEGPPNLGHGGAIAAALDESMSLLMHASGRTARTAGLTVRYVRPALLESPLEITARAVDGVHPRFNLVAEITDPTRDNRVVATASAEFAVIGGPNP